MGGKKGLAGVTKGMVVWTMARIRMAIHIGRLDMPRICGRIEELTLVTGTCTRSLVDWKGMVFVFNEIEGGTIPVRKGCVRSSCSCSGATTATRTADLVGGGHAGV
jgi:hypothetical protein